MILGKWLSMAISTAAQLGVADELASGPKTAAEIAAKIDVKPDALYRLMRATAGTGVFRLLPDGRFEQTELSEPLRSDAPDSVRAMAMMLLDDWHHASWGQLPWCVKTGQPAPFNVYGKHLFELMQEHPEKGVNFNNAMSQLSTPQAAAVVEAYDFSGFQHIVDVGGGHGYLLAQILKSVPKLHGTLFEMPHIVEGAKSEKYLPPLGDRVGYAPGNFFADAPPAADAYVMKFIIHDWDDEKSGKILSLCRSTIQPGGKLLVVDMVVPEGNEPALSKLVDLEMLVLPGGKERTEKEFKDLLAASGFKLERIIPTSGPMSIVEAVPV